MTRIERGKIREIRTRASSQKRQLGNNKKSEGPSRSSLVHIISVQSLLESCFYDIIPYQAFRISLKFIAKNQGLVLALQLTFLTGNKHSWHQALARPSLFPELIVTNCNRQDHLDCTARVQFGCPKHSYVSYSIVIIFPNTNHCEVLQYQHNV